MRRSRLNRTGLRNGQVWIDDRGRRRIVRIHACHIISQGAGGYDCGNTVPMQGWLHREQHRSGIESFQTKYQVDLTAEAVQLDAKYESERSLEHAA